MKLSKVLRYVNQPKDQLRLSKEQEIWVIKTRKDNVWDELWIKKT